MTTGRINQVGACSCRVMVLSTLVYHSHEYKLCMMIIQFMHPHSMLFSPRCGNIMPNTQGFTYVGVNLYPIEYLHLEICDSVHFILVLRLFKHML